MSAGTKPSLTKAARASGQPKAKPSWPAPTICPNVRDIPLAQLEPDPDQPRTEFDPDSIASLAGSLRELGQLQPIRVRRLGEEHRYAVVDGERRWRAAGEAGLRTLQCVVVEGHDDPGELLVEQLAANEAREDLSPLEQAGGYARALKARGWTQGQLAAALGISQSRVAKRIGLLKLPDEVQDLIRSGDLDASTAYEIAGAAEWQRTDLAFLAVQEQWTRAEVTAEVKWMDASGRSPRSRAERAAEESAVALRLGTPPETGPPQDAGADTGPPPATHGSDEAGGAPAIPPDRVLIYDRPLLADSPGIDPGDESSTAAYLDRMRAERAAPPTVIAGGGAASPGPPPSYWTALAGDGQTKTAVSVNVAPGAPGIVEALELALAEARRRWGPACYWPEGTRVRIDHRDHVNHGRRGAIDCPARGTGFDPPGAAGTAWVKLDGDDHVSPYAHALLVRDTED